MEATEKKRLRRNDGQHEAAAGKHAERRAGIDSGRDGDRPQHIPDVRRPHNGLGNLIGDGGKGGDPHAATSSLQLHE